MLKERSMVEINCYDVYFALVVNKPYGTDYIFVYNPYGLDKATFTVCPELNLVYYCLDIRDRSYSKLTDIDNHFEFLQIVKSIFTHLHTYGLEYVRQK